MRSVVFASISSIVVLASACGDDGGSTVVNECEFAADGTTAYPYHIDEIILPTAAEVPDYGFDYTGDGVVDNAVASLLDLAAGFGIDAEELANTSIADGTALALAELRTSSLTSSDCAQSQVYIGACPNDAKNCEALTIDTFALSDASPLDAFMNAKITSSGFSGGPKTFSFSLPIGETPITVSLNQARLKMTGISSDAIADIVIAGLLSQNEINTKLIPVVADLLNEQLALPEAGCSVANNVCTCTGETAGQIVGAVSPGNDCVYTGPEVASAPIVQGILTPDVDSDGDDVLDSISLGIGATARGITDITGI